ncbi:MAG: TetR/AcrR family transcriptional regulator [Panacagrimonas sp.]
MARAREFDETEVIHRALNQFWSGGYRATSLEQLLKATGLSKSSLYETFGSKRQLLIQCLAAYEEAIVNGPVAPLMRADAGRKEIQATFAAIINNACSEHGQHGCFANNCLSEVAPHDALVMQATDRITGKVEDAFCRAVQNGQADGSIGSPESARSLGRFLRTTLSGINLAAKSRPDHAKLADIARVALQCLD